MNARQRKYRDGDIVFREGDPSRSAFILEQGRIELTKDGAVGTVRLAVLDAGEMFGEMGILDDSVRSATARALGKVVLSEVPRDEFLRAVREEPDLAAQIMEKLVARLRAADEALVRSRGAGGQNQAASALPPPGQPQGQQKVGFLARLFGKRPAPRTAEIEILIADLVGDTDGAAGRRIAEALADAAGTSGGVNARPRGQVLEPDQGGDGASQLAALTATGRQWLAEADADLLIWGSVTEEGRIVRLRFLSAANDEEDRPGAFTVTSWMEVPAEFEPEAFDPLLKAVAIAATVPRTAQQLQFMRATLPGLLEAAMRTATRPPIELDRHGQASIQLSFGAAAAITGHMLGDPRWLEHARDSLDAAIRNLARTGARLDWAMAHRHLGAVLAALAEKSGDAKVLERAVEALEAALTVIGRNDLPLAWGLIQYRLGLIHARLDQFGAGQGSEHLTQACAAYQNALQVLNMTETPYKWAEAKHNLAQALQVLGGQERRADLLEKAIDACHDSLEVRNRTRFPALWASTHNNLGSALFLLGRLNDDDGTLEEAATAFEEALSTYRTLGAAKAVQVTERNLKRVEESLATRRPPRRGILPTKFDWQDEKVQALGDIADGDKDGGDRGGG